MLWTMKTRFILDGTPPRRKGTYFEEVWNNPNDGLNTTGL